MLPYYGTLKSKREQKRLQMGPGHSSSSLMTCMGGGGGSLAPLQQRISSVDDLRPSSNCNGISKSQVRLMREMFEQQQHKLSGKCGGDKGSSQGTTSASNLTRKYSEGETVDEVDSAGKVTGNSGGSTFNLNGGQTGGDLVALENKPPAIQPCSGVLELVSTRSSGPGAVNYN